VDTDALISSSTPNPYTDLSVSFSGSKDPLAPKARCRIYVHIRERSAKANVVELVICRGVLLALE